MAIAMPSNWPTGDARVPGGGEHYALAANDRAALAAAPGDLSAALAGFTAALEIDALCWPAHYNLAMLEGENNRPRVGLRQAETSADPIPGLYDNSSKTRVAVVSFLFNWPSTGGGIVHTFELCQFIRAAGYEIRLIYACYPPWGIGGITGELPFPSDRLDFVEGDWTMANILGRYSAAVDAFDAHIAIVTDSWNIKPLLADALRGRRVILRLQAMECLCPLNNVRLLPEPGGVARQCTLHQLAVPDACRACIAGRGHQSGALHRAERELCDVGTPEYDAALRRAFRAAEAVLVVNPLTEALVRPYAKNVNVVTAGMDPARFPWPLPDAADAASEGRPLRLLFAGLVDEWMKGFHVLHDACSLLWRTRRDFELLATANPPGRVDEFTLYVGWLSQEELPRQIRAADVLIMPTIAQEGLGRTAVEAMACGRPVVASRIGGLPATVVEGATGLLFEPGDASDLARKLAALLDDTDLRRRMGEAGRKRFEEYYSWPVIIDRHYRPLLGPTTRPSLAVAGQSEFPPVAAGLGCVLAVRDRPAVVLERTFQTCAYQTVQPIDKVLLDFGSAAASTEEYAALCERFGWRLVRAGPAGREWSLPAAYNLAVSALSDDVTVVFKSDVDVLLGRNVLETAARLGADAFCQFQYFTTPSDVRYPEAFSGPDDLIRVFEQRGRPTPSVGQGLFACPARWFRQVGGFDLAYASWGYEDHDLRWRAEQSLPVVDVDFHEALLVHQWHPPARDAGPAEVNRAYFERMKASGSVVRNGGRLTPLEAQPTPAALAAPPTPRIVVATRSLHDDLYQLSGDLLDFGGAGPHGPVPRERWRFTGVDAAGYFRELARLDADWVVNLDEDAFLLDPAALARLVRQMGEQGYAACGLPDGGTVAIRRHNPAACNACFNVLDVRRVRAAWRDWDAALAARFRQEFVDRLPGFASRSEFAFDHFEPYYGPFFALLAAGERILYLDGRAWDDGVSTVVIAPDGAPLVLHAWYGRDWAADPATRGRIRAAFDYARSHQRRLRDGAVAASAGLPAAYAPVIPARVDQAKLQDAVAEFLGLPVARAMGLYRGCRALHERERYAERLGEYKTLCFEEAYVLYALMSERRPASLADVGTRSGKSARRLLDIRAALGLDAPLTCFDGRDQIEHLRPDEAAVAVGDLRGRFREAVFDPAPPGLAFLDLHDRAVLRESVAATLADRRGWVLAVQCCGRGLCNPHMAVAEDDPNVTTLTGLWERYVLAEAFGVVDPLDPRLDAAETPTHRLRVFDTPHGLAVILPK